MSLHTQVVHVRQLSFKHAQPVYADSWCEAQLHSRYTVHIFTITSSQAFASGISLGSRTWRCTPSSHTLNTLLSYRKRFSRHGK